MTQENKQLLLVDLSARLPYGVKCKHRFSDYNEILDGILFENKICTFTDDCESCLIYDVKPYLFPLSSMTKEQKEEYYDLCDSTLTEWGNPIWFDSVGSIDWLNKNHFDFRNLICRGLAIDCTNLNIY